MKYWYAKSTNSAFDMAAVCIFNTLHDFCYIWIWSLIKLHFWIFLKSVQTPLDHSIHFDKHIKIIAEDYDMLSVITFRPLLMSTQSKFWARKNFCRLNLHSAVYFLYVLFFSFSFHLTHPSALHQGMHFFLVTPLHSWQVATAWEDSLSCRAMLAAGAHVWLGCQWITLYGERKLKMQGYNLLERGTDLKASFFLLAALLEVFQICHSWVWTELRCTGNNKPDKAASSLYLNPSYHYVLANTWPC